MVPNGWENVLLGEVFDFRNGINADKSQYGQGVKFVNVMDVFGNNILTEPKIIGRISISDKKLDDNRLEYGDVLFNRTSETFDEIAMSAVYLDDADATFGGFVIRGRPLTNNLDPKYTVYAFQDSNFRKQVIKLGQGAVRANIGQKDLVKVELLVPSLPEQQKIAKILSTWDKAISTTERLIENSTQQKKALMQQLLTGKKRLLDDEGKRFEGEWEEVTLGKVSEMNSGGTPKSTVSEYYDGNIPWVSIADMTKHGKWISTTAKYLTDSGLANSSARLYPKGTVLYAMYASIGECSIAQVPVSSSQAILGIRTKEKLNNLYLYYYLNNMRSKILLMGQQGTQSNLNAGMVKNFQMQLPPLKEQQKIATVLTNADKEIELLEQQLADLQQEKKALMQVLLTGKKRVVVDEEVA